MKPRVYISGRMTGLPEYNFPAFHAAAAAWRAAGWEVRNPAESFEGATDLPYRVYVEHDVDTLLACEAIAMLDGWDEEGARGSLWEYAIATRLLNLKVYAAAQPVRVIRHSCGANGFGLAPSDHCEVCSG